MFLDVATGFPDSIHDARMLRVTKLYEDPEANIILGKTTDLIQNKEVRLLLISDGAYPPT